MLRYSNPIYGHYFADPFVFRHGHAFFAIGTDGRPSDDGWVFQMLQSSNLVDWQPLGRALVRPDPALGTDFWAPEIAKHEGRFYLYYSVGFEDRRHHLRVATAERPQGPYEDLGPLTNPDELQFAIDASPFQDDAGQWYLYHSIDFLDEVEGRPGTALVVDRLVDMTRLEGSRRTVLRATQDWQRFQQNRSIYGGVWDWHTLEGPFVCKRLGRYWCLYSAGNWQNETYGVDFCVADHPMGPFVGADIECPRVLRTVPGRVLGPGHNSVVTDAQGRDFIAYHAWDVAQTGRRFCIDPLVWTDEGPRCPGPTWTPQHID